MPPRKLICKTCPAVLSRGNKTGECVNCSKQTQARERTKPKLSGDTFQGTGDRAELTKIVARSPRTLNEMVEACEIDLEEWEIERWVANKWEMGAKDPAGAVHTTPLFQIKVWLRRKTAVLAAREEIRALLTDAKKVVPMLPRIKRPAAGSHTLELAIPDLHLGKLAWAPETGYADYDLKIAQDRFEAALEALIARTSFAGINQVLFPIGNDFLHADTKFATTTKGTQLDTDSRFHKTFTYGRRMVTQAINRLRHIAPVRVVMVPGNHDQLSTFHLGDSLECFYANTKDVTVDNAPTLRKYVGFGKVAIMFTHGDKGKPQNWPLLFATEQSKLFGDARFREIHAGHLHTTRVQEYNGVHVRTFAALCPPDAWHSENQFVGNHEAAGALLWHPNDGLVSQAHYTVPAAA